jgi:hypothetical protein
MILKCVVQRADSQDINGRSRPTDRSQGSRTCRKLSSQDPVRRAKSAVNLRPKGGMQPPWPVKAGLGAVYLLL